MRFETLLTVDLAAIPSENNISWHNIKAKLNYLLDTRNTAYAAKMHEAWQTFIVCDQTEKLQKLNYFLAIVQHESKLRLDIADKLSLYRNKNIKPENIADFLLVQHSFSQLLGCDNTHIDNILLHLEWLLSAALLIKQYALAQINNAEKRKSANAEVDALIMQLKDYRHAVCINILIRLETVTKHGFIDDFSMMAIANVNAEHLDLKNINIEEWSESRFIKYYLFVMKYGDSKQLARLKALEFSFGVVYITEDNTLVAHPKIYAKDELLLTEPWFGWIFWGLDARYRLFAEGFLQIELNTKIKLAEIKLADFEPQTISSMKGRLSRGFSAIEQELARVEDIKWYLWDFLYSKEAELCERWQIYLAAANNNICQIQLLQLQQLSLQKNDVLALFLHTDALRSLAAILQMLAHSEISSDFMPQIYSNFFKVIFVAVLQILLRHDLESQQYKQALARFFADDMASNACVVMGQDYYNDAKILFNSLDNIADFRELSIALKKYVATDIYVAILHDFCPLASAENGDAIIMQAYLNRRLMAGETICAAITQELRDYYSGCLSFSSYSVSLNIIGNYYESLEGVLFRNYVNTADFLADISAVLATYKNILLDYSLYLRLVQQLEIYLQHNSSYDAEYLPVILEYGSSDIKVNYCLELFKKILLSGASIHTGLVACNYYKIIKYDAKLGMMLTDAIQQFLIMQLTTDYINATEDELKQLFADIAADSPILQNFSLKSQETISAIIDMKFASFWEPAASYIITLFASNKTQHMYNLKLVRYLAVEPEYSSNAKEALAYLKHLNQSNYYYWSCFGLGEKHAIAIYSHISFAISSMRYLDDRADFLDFMFCNRRLVEFYKLADLQQSWEGKKLLLTDKQHVGSLVAKLAPAISQQAFDNILAILAILIKNNFDLGDAKYVAAIIKKLIGLLWGYVREVIEQSLFSDDLSDLIKYKEQVITKLATCKFLTIEQQYELKFLLWLTSIERHIANSSLEFWRLSQDVKSSDINCLIIYLYYINYYPKQYADKIHAKFLPYKRYLTKEGIIHYFCKNIAACHNMAKQDVTVKVESKEESAQVQLQLAMTNKLKSIDFSKSTIIERKNAADTLNYLLEFAASDDIEHEAKLMLGQLNPEVFNSNGYSPGFFSTHRV